MRGEPFTRTGSYTPAMSFDEIGRELGIGKRGAFMLYRSAMKKIKNRPLSAEKLKELVDFQKRRQA